MEKIFALWPSVSQMARDLDVPIQTCHAWKRRGSIPSKHDVAIVKHAASNNIVLTYEQVARIRAGEDVQIEEPAE